MKYSNGKTERRKAKRIPAEDLPEALQDLQLSFADGPTLTVKIVDASSTGISLDVPVPVYSITDYNVTLYTKNSSLKLEDELVYIKPIDEKSSRVSINFSNQEDLDKYRKLLKKAT